MGNYLKFHMGVFIYDITALNSLKTIIGNVCNIKVEIFQVLYKLPQCFTMYRLSTSYAKWKKDV